MTRPSSIPPTSPTTSRGTGTGGLPTGWILAALAALGGGAWHYRAEVHGPGNRRAPRPAGLPSDTKAMPYAEYLRTPPWAAARKMALDRDGRRCTACGGADALQAHHLTYARRGHEKLKDLTTLCRRYHEARHAGRPPGPPRS